MRVAIRFWLVSVFLATGALAQTQGEPKTEPLWPKGTPDKIKNGGKEIGNDRWVRNVHEPSLTIYLPAKTASTKPALVICPGGGYGGLAFDHEGKQVARWFNGLGGAAFILKYRHAPYKHPVPMNDVLRAIRTVRHRAKAFNVDPTKIGVIGFSAGGHLASTAVTHFDEGIKDSDDPVMQTGSRPDFGILVYPVISMQKDVTHGGSRNNLLGKNPSEALVKKMSNATQVTAKTPPTLLVHSTTDRVVKIKNSEEFYEACKKAGVESQLLVYKSGRHGYGLGGQGKEYSVWPKKCVEWLIKINVLPAQ